MFIFIHIVEGVLRFLPQNLVEKRIFIADTMTDVKLHILESIKDFLADLAALEMVGFAINGLVFFFLNDSHLDRRRLKNS